MIKKLIVFVFAASMIQAASVPIVKQLLVSKTQTATVNTCTGKNIWRLIYDNGQVISVSQSSGKTMTIHSLFCGTEQTDTTAQIAALKLAPAKTAASTPAPAAPCNGTQTKEIFHGASNPTLAHTPVASCPMQVYLNGLIQEPTTDYKLSGRALTFSLQSSFDASTVIQVAYWY